MANTVRVRFIGPDPVEIDLRSIDSDIPALRQVVEPGEVIEVAADIAHGRQGDIVYRVDADGEPVLDPDTGDPVPERDEFTGEPVIVNHYAGLLNQATRWELARKPRSKGDESPTQADEADTKEA